MKSFFITSGPCVVIVKVRARECVATRTVVPNENNGHTRIKTWMLNQFGMLLYVLPFLTSLIIGASKRSKRRWVR